MRFLVSAVQRACRAAFAVWVAFVLSQPVTVRACPLKGGVLEELSPGALADGAHDAAEHHQHHHMVAMDVTPHEHAPVHHHLPSKCNCIGDCCATVAVALPVLGRYVPLPQQLAVRRATFPVPESTFEEPDHMLPPSTAPPSFPGQRSAA